jgi:hypothetical protein
MSSSRTIKGRWRLSGFFSSSLMGIYETLKFLPENMGMTMAVKIFPMMGTCVAMALARVIGHTLARNVNHHFGLLGIRSSHLS